MGMYDELFINTNLLPVSDEEKNIIGDKPGWQTKDLECSLTEIYITDEGALKINTFTYEEVPKEQRPYPNEEGFRGIIGSMKRTNEKIIDVPYPVDEIHFYSSINEVWYGFMAKFKDNKLVEITGGKEQEKPNF